MFELKNQQTTRKTLQPRLTQTKPGEKLPPQIQSQINSFTVKAQSLGVTGQIKVFLDEDGGVEGGMDVHGRKFIILDNQLHEIFGHNLISREKWPFED